MIPAPKPPKHRHCTVCGKKSVMWWRDEDGQQRVCHKCFNELYARFRQKVLERDNYKCVRCGYQNKTGEGLEVHHVDRKGYRKHIISEAETRCHRCHAIEHGRRVA